VRPPAEQAAQLASRVTQVDCKTPGGPIIRPEVVRQAALFVLDGLPLPERYQPALAWWALIGLRLSGALDDASHAGAAARRQA